MNMDKYFMWIHYKRLHNHNKAKHNKIVCIFLGIYYNLKVLRQHLHQEESETKYIILFFKRDTRAASFKLNNIEVQIYRHLDKKQTRPSDSINHDKYMLSLSTRRLAYDHDKRK